MGELIDLGILITDPLEKSGKVKIILHGHEDYISNWGWLVEEQKRWAAKGVKTVIQEGEFNGVIKKWLERDQPLPGNFWM